MHVFFLHCQKLSLIQMLSGEDRFRNFYGQYGARISRKQSVHRHPDIKFPHSYLIKFISPILFCAPDVHLRAMEGLWVDRLTVKWRWGAFFAKLNDEWTGHIVYVSLYGYYYIPKLRWFADRQVFCSMPT